MHLTKTPSGIKDTEGYRWPRVRSAIMHKETVEPISKLYLIKLMFMKEWHETR